MFPLGHEVLGQVLVPARGAGNKMAQLIIKENGLVVPWRMLQQLQVDEVHSTQELKKKQVFNSMIKRIWGTSLSLPYGADVLFKDWEEYEDAYQKTIDIPDNEDAVNSNGHLPDQQPAYDNLINAEVHLQLDDKMQSSKII